MISVTIFFSVEKMLGNEMLVMSTSSLVIMFYME